MSIFGGSQYQSQVFASERNEVHDTDDGILMDLGTKAETRA